MQLVIKDNLVIATHPDYIRIPEGAYPDSIIVSYDGEIKEVDDGLPPDPRTDEEKKDFYKDQRRLEYPTTIEQFDLMYWDKMNGTTVWRDAITTIKVKYPKPQAK